MGYESLKALFAARIYGPADPLDRFVTEDPYRLIKQNGHYCLKVEAALRSEREHRPQYGFR